MLANHPHNSIVQPETYTNDQNDSFLSGDTVVENALQKNVNMLLDKNDKTEKSDEQRNSYSATTKRSRKSKDRQVLVGTGMENKTDPEEPNEFNDFGASPRPKRDPRVPIKTYKWEDIKRSRSKGGYPWTYLYKEPYDEELDPEPYTMEGMRKSKSSSTMGKSDIEISEVTESGNHTPVEIGDLPEKSDDLQIITEPDDHSIKCSSSSVVIEECDANNKEKRSPGMFFLDSAESSDDISQYLDKEDHGPADKKSNDCEMDTNTESDNKDEPQNRKRKLSAESSYSRISQTKSAILKKIKDAKAKIKVPKMSFPTSKLKKPLPKKKSNSPPETKKETVKSNISSKNIKPLYIYIPLKPPQGQTDEFSHLEYDTENSKKELKIKPASFRDLVKNIKHLQDVKDIEEEAEEGTDTKEEGDIQNGANAQEEFQEMKLSDDEGDIAME
ncbi:hypothetical protein JTB14_016261 [Gonioctena quinquepunctata]|nr:hypothetical protein JTB14_016261 [Gonioctena quinquepunctata]